MSMTTALLAAEETTTRELPMPSWVIGLIAIVVFLFLLGVTWSFRGTHHKYAPPAAPGDGQDGHASGEDAAHWPEHPGHH